MPGVGSGAELLILFAVGLVTVDSIVGLLLNGVVLDCRCLFLLKRDGDLLIGDRWCDLIEGGLG